MIELFLGAGIVAIGIVAIMLCKATEGMLRGIAAVVTAIFDGLAKLHRAKRGDPEPMVHPLPTTPMVFSDKRD